MISMKLLKSMFAVIAVLMLVIPVIAIPTRAYGQGQIQIGVIFPDYDEIFEVAIAPDKSIYFLAVKYYYDQDQYILAKLGYNGSIEWSKAIIGKPIGNIYVTSITVSDGYIYVGGAMWNSTIFDHVPFIAKFASNGILLKFVTIRHGGGIDRITATPDGSLYVTGCLRGERRGPNWSTNACVDGFVAKFSPNLSLEWIKRITTTEPYLFGVDRKGGTLVVSNYVYIAQDTYFVNSSPNKVTQTLLGTLVAKFDSRGNPIWIKLLNGGRSQDINVDSHDNIYVVGYTNSFGAGGYDGFVAKISPSGGLLWFKTIGGSGYDDAYGIAVDSRGYIYVTGETDSFTDEWGDAYVAKLDPSGNLAWFRAVGYSNIWELGYSISVSSECCLLVAGGASESGFFVAWGYHNDVDAGQVAVQDHTDDVSFKDLVVTVDSPAVDVYTVSDPPVENISLAAEPMYGEALFDICSTKAQSSNISSGENLGGISEPLYYEAIITLIVVAVPIAVVTATVVSRKQT